jgi:outer membrane receptor protein involved in Fe transport
MFFAGSGGNINFFFNSNDPQTGHTGLYGYYTISQTGQIGLASSQNDAIFVQDSWQIHPHVTLNIGVRTERETVPSFGFGALPPAIVFGWGDKLAPRIGAAWDVFGNGKDEGLRQLQCLLRHDEVRPAAWFIRRRNADRRLSSS